MPSRQEFDEAVKTIHGYLSVLATQGTEAERRTQELAKARDQRQAEVDDLARERDRQRAALTDEIERDRRQARGQLEAQIAPRREELERLIARVDRLKAEEAHWEGRAREAETVRSAIANLLEQREQLARSLDRLTEQSKTLGDTVAALEARKAAAERALAELAKHTARR